METYASIWISLTLVLNFKASHMGRNFGSMPTVRIGPDYDPLIVLRGSTVNLTCIITNPLYSSIGPLPFEWSIDGEDNYTIKDGIRLTINNIWFDTVVGCKVFISNNSTTVSANKTIEVQWPPVITSPLPDIYINLGEPLYVVCYVDAKPRPFPNRILWQRRGASAHIIQEYHDGPNNAVAAIVHRTSAADAGLYVCEATNLLQLSGQKSMYHYVKKNFTVYLQYGPEFEHPIPDFTLSEGDNVTIPCSVKAHRPYGQYFEKVKDGVIFRTHTLVFNNISCEQSGIYRCTANNTWRLKTGVFEERVAYNTFLLGVSCGPEKTIEILTNGPPPVVVYPYDDVTVYCYSSCSPPCSTMWYLPDNNVVYGNELNVNYSTSSPGNYTCQAKNGIGEATKYVEIMKESSPRLIRHELIQPKHFNMVSFGAGLGAGVCLLAVAVLVGVLVYRIHKQNRDAKRIEKKTNINFATYVNSPQDETGSNDGHYMEIDSAFRTVPPDYAKLKTSSRVLSNTE